MSCRRDLSVESRLETRWKNSNKEQKVVITFLPQPRCAFQHQFLLKRCWNNARRLWGKLFVPWWKPLRAFHVLSLRVGFDMTKSRKHFLDKFRFCLERRQTKKRQLGHVTGRPTLGWWMCASRPVALSTRRIMISLLELSINLRINNTSHLSDELYVEKCKMEKRESIEIRKSRSERAEQMRERSNRNWLRHEHGKINVESAFDSFLPSCAEHRDSHFWELAEREEFLAKVEKRGFE